MIELFFAPTPNGRRAAIILAEAGLPHRVTRVDLKTKSEKLLGANPLGAIPTIIDDDGPGGQPLALSQSGAIMLYVAERVGRFIPSDKRQRALAMQWFMLACSDAAGASAAAFQLQMRAPEPSKRNAQFFEEKFVTLVHAGNRQLADHDYLAGELSVADFALYPFAAARRPALEQAGDVPNMMRWMDKIGARPGVAAAMAIA